MAPLPLSAGLVRTIFSRQTVSNNNDQSASSSGLSGGAIAGIVIGSICGVLLIIWIIRSCSNLGAPPLSEGGSGSAWYDNRWDDRDRRRSSHHSHSHSHSQGRRHSRGHYDDAYPPRRKTSEMRVVQPVAVYDDQRRRSRSPRDPPPVYVYESDRRSRSSRGRSRPYV